LVEFYDKQSKIYASLETSYKETSSKEKRVNDNTNIIDLPKQSIALNVNTMISSPQSVKFAPIKVIQTNTNTNIPNPLIDLPPELLNAQHRKSCTKKGLVF
jgi:hypothetical protein